ncbi:hypothetical protein [Alkalihalobacterium bogoriense]|uniref:hypothetical protein n=1 Tax=Alkalihalobacterium bogoriense TaxID=246272 RepID=UPI00047DE32E|nr:hypothetical protein [Alkalihalobacterium bogoriense]
MSKMKRALDVVNDLRNLADSLEGLTFVFKVNEPEVTATAEARGTAKEELQPEKQPTLEEVRAKLASLSQDGKQVEVKELITSFGAKKLSDVPAQKYSELLEKAEEL